MTLIELITTVAISSVLFVIVFVFITDSVEELVDNNVKISSIDNSFEFKDIMTRGIKSGFTESTVFTGSTIEKNHVLYLTNEDETEALLVGVVNLETSKIQPDYIFGNNFMGYRVLSSQEIQAIDLDQNEIYNIKFHNDKILKGLKIKDFKVDLYNEKQILDINYSVINLADDNQNGVSFNNFFIEKENLVKYNLVF